jgi:hypothetical protein
MTERARHACARRRGSVLVPVVAAMLILLLCGFALTELSSSQRMQSVLAVDSAKAYWIADAGVWHAVYAQSAIASPVAFGGGTYTVAKSAQAYTATATWGEATRTAFEDFDNWADGIPSPLDEAAAVASAVKKDADEFTLTVTSIWPTDVEIASFDLSTSGTQLQGHRWKLNGHDIWHEHGGWNLPTYGTPLNNGTQSDRTIPAGASYELLYHSHVAPTGTVTYYVNFYFTNGLQTNLVFSITWT